MVCHAMWCHIMQYSTMSCHVTSCQVMKYNTMSCHAMQFHTVPCHVMTRCATLSKARSKSVLLYIHNFDLLTRIKRQKSQISSEFISRWKLIIRMDKLSISSVATNFSWNLGRVVRSTSGRLYALNLMCSIAIRPSLELKARP